ncbi:hypothetical protein COCSADRAFT_41177 [Bipolaris sorokiniana ND90Pr]|uniref:Uncharacterized protein n=1 Tax=Cochliobolus sativus (strain ND90Pr / ATCC 201652) TaxID=665912 RepID=M2SQB1_COCSN|nr:uncharacterized protein COCSADRAFT_41177 [Bipolaris sorokiniana ND90Pr]EMD59311.1 hypothetical protein COCSADRAFT_41177 [Bipolaris sorokiniana ND90Pr]
MFDKIRGKSPSGHSKHDSSDIHQGSPLSIPGPPSYAASSSTPVPPFQTRFASLSLHMEDRIRFLRFPEPVISACRSAILSNWPQGISSERPYANSHEIKLDGYPWRGFGKDAAQARRLVKGVLSTLHANGWILTLTTDVSKTAADKDTLLFRYQAPPPARHEWCSIAFSRQSRLRFIDCPPELYASLPQRIGSEWLKGQSEYAPGIWEFELHGYPWSPTGKTTMQVRELLMALVEMLEEEGWSVYASIDQKSSGGQGTSESDTWYCCRIRGWEKGMPVYWR